MKTLLSECGGRIKVLALTGIRSDYDLFYQILKALDADRRFSVGVLVTGAHLTALHRRSVRLVEKDGFRIAARIPNLRRSDAVSGRVQSAGRLLIGLGRALEREKPDLLLVLGDREEALMGATAGSYMGIPVVHLAGGDDTRPAGGDVDEEARHATTKLSHVHLTMAAAHARRVRRLGEEPWRVAAVGNPGLDRLREKRWSAPEAAAPYAVVIHHALSSARREAPRELDLCLRACAAAGLEVYVGAPNSDPGHRGLLRVLRKRRSPRVHFYGNLPRARFIGLLRGTRCLVGNSSLGLLEAPFLGLPCVNVGERQRGRLAALNVQFVPARPGPIFKAVKKAAFDAAYRARVRRSASPYGDGRTAPRVVRILAGLPEKKKLLAKHITF